MKEYYDRQWLVVELIPGLIECHTAMQFGAPTITGSRIHTEVAAGAYENEEWNCYGNGLDKDKAFVAMCFEAGREYQRSRKLRQRIDEACKKGWEKVPKSGVGMEE